MNVGILTIQKASALGNITSGTVVASGATLQVQNTITVVGEPLTLSGSGYGNNGSLPQGALAINATNDTWTGNITLTGDTTIGSTTANDTLTINGSVSGGFSLTKVGPGIVTLAAANFYTNNTTVQAGTLTLSNSNAYTGATSVNGAAYGGAFVPGILTLNLLGSIQNTSGITVNQNSALTLDNTVIDMGDNGTTTFGRLANNVPVALNTGTLTLLANNNVNTATNESFGVLTLASGQSIVNAGYAAAPAAGATSSLNPASLSRNPGATVNFLGGTANITPLGLVNNSLVITGAITAGSFTLSYNGQTTTSIIATVTGAALASAIQSALSALLNVGTGGINGA